MNDLIHNNQKQMSLKAYRKMKIKMLKEFCIFLNDEEKAHMESLQNEIQIDNYCISLIRNSY